MAAPEQAEIRYPDSLPLALLAFHRTVGPIYKSSSAKYGPFADLRTVLEAVMPPLLEQGLVLSQTLSTNANGCTSLTTTLTHAPSDEKISSEWVLPSLDQLLARVHELRTTAIDRFPLDLQLAAMGALPPVLPPRPDAAAAAATAATANEAEPGGRPALPPPPARSPGLRLDDQLKGLYTLLGQVGTTTNPLHSMGGAITYCRRYQILSLLCLAAEDNDGNDASPRETSERSAPRAPSPNGTGTGNGNGSSGTAPRPAATRSRRRPALDPPAASPQDQGQAQGQAPAAVAAAPAAPPVADPTVAAPPMAASAEAAPAPMAPASTAPSVGAQHSAALDDSALLTLEQVQNLIGSIRHLPPEGIAAVAAGFRQRFGIPEKQMVSDYIKTTEHAAFITSMCRQYTDAHQANLVPV